MYNSTFGQIKNWRKIIELRLIDNVKVNKVIKNM